MERVPSARRRSTRRTPDGRHGGRCSSRGSGGGSGGRREGQLAGIEGTARMLAGPLTSGGRSLVLVVGVSLADREETLSGLTRSFLVGVPAAVALASGI